MHAHEDLPRKKIKKLAARYSDAEVLASLEEDPDCRAFLFEEPSGSVSVMFWSAYNGAMISADDDSVRAFAQLDFLRRHSYPVFRSLDEVHAYAVAQGWPRKNRHATSPNA